MKRLPELITLCCILFAFLTSGSTGKNSFVDPGMGFPIQQTDDTAGLIDHLLVDSFKLEIIPPSSGVQFFRDGIVFLSNTKYEGKMLPEHVSFGSIEAYTAMVKDSSLGFHMLFSPSSSFSFPCEALTFSSDFKTMYFTRIPKKEKLEKIYQAEYKSDGKGGSGWIADENPLTFCTGNSRYTHPALSSDGNMMIFASDRTGSLGGMDLFITRKVGGKWSNPENLGNSINTPRDECFPYLDQENNLFFSSDGRAGFGGYDIFTCRFKDDTWEIPKNLTRKINSEYDDIAFSINRTDGKSAFYTKKPESGKSEMQLFKVTLKQDLAENAPSSISYVYNGKAGAKTEMVAMTPAGQPKEPEKESSKTPPAEEKKPVIVPASKPQAAKAVIIQSTSALPEELKDVVVYRIQFLSSGKPRKENTVVINGTTYKTYEYLYQGAYRYTIGQFTSLSPARALQKICKQSGYPDAFVAAFKNNNRSLDLANFK
jgi:hypothetical protein